jgi:DNA-binding response OmpR family regulator
VTRSVLIVDDEPNIVLSLEYLLQRAGYHVRVARDGQEALDAIEHAAPDLVLLDVMLPRLSGFDVCRRIRANPAWKDMRVVMLTAKGRDVEASQGLAFGADAYVTKPFSTRDLLAQIGALLQGRG